MLHDEDRLGVGDVCELRSVDEVADCVHARLAGLAELVDHHEPALVDLHLRALQAELIGEGTSTDRHHHGVHLERLAVTERDRGRAVIVGRVAVHRHTGPDVDLLALEHLLDDLRDVFVEAGKDLRQPFEDGDLRAEVGERGRELAADRSTTDDGDPGGQRVEVEDFVAGHDRTAALEVRDESGDRARGEHHEVTGDGRGAGRPVAVVRLDVHGAARRKGADAVEDLDLASLAHRTDATDELFDDALLAFLGLRERDRCRAAGLDPEVGGMVDVALHRSGLEERLGGDAAPVQARASQCVLLDEGHIEPCRRAVQGGGISAGPTADDDEIEVVGSFAHGVHRSAPSAMRLRSYPSDRPK